MSLFKDASLRLRKGKQKYLEGLQDHGLHTRGKLLPTCDCILFPPGQETIASTFSPETHCGVVTSLEPRKGGHTGDSLSLNGHNHLAHLEDDEP